MLICRNNERNYNVFELTIKSMHCHYNLQKTLRFTGNDNKKWYSTLFALLLTMQATTKATGTSAQVACIAGRIKR